MDIHAPSSRKPCELDTRHGFLRKQVEPDNFVVRETLRLPKKHPGPTVPRTCLPVEAALPLFDSATDRACAIVGYRRARNAAARRSHAQRRRKYCEDPLQRYQVSLHYQVPQTRTTSTLGMFAYHNHHNSSVSGSMAAIG
ncbi:MAG: hypothetical protein OXG36_16450 [Caldilineaceae bacterium]|nr:hypothetical protein [Caldilineaceae bacterium]